MVLTSADGGSVESVDRRVLPEFVFAPVVGGGILGVTFRVFVVDR
jgi:hypothetical protein